MLVPAIRQLAQYNRGLLHHAALAGSKNVGSRCKMFEKTSKSAGDIDATLSVRSSTFASGNDCTKKFVTCGVKYTNDV